MNQLPKQDETLSHSSRAALNPRCGYGENQ
jgi:hypothetical protein